MPCVFPVLSLKAATIINGPSDSLKLKLNGITYTLGVLTSMLILSLTLLTLRGVGNWGFHMQSPVFSLVLLYVMFVIGLCFLCGLSDIPFTFSCSDKVNRCFFGGMLTTLVMTPCVTSFMAPAISFALIQPSIFISVGIFLILGFGISFPYLIISLLPNTLEFLPRPNEWMTALKHFPFISVSLSAIWLFWVLIKELSTVSVLTGLLSLAFSIWIWIFTSDIKPPIKPVISTLFFRLIRYRSSYPKQHKKLFFKRIQKPRR
ncbi:hypothetical protein [Wolbachia endosymbiont of Atemnus politus]